MQYQANELIRELRGRIDYNLEESLQLESTFNPVGSGNKRTASEHFTPSIITKADFSVHLYKIHYSGRQITFPLTATNTFGQATVIAHLIRSGALIMSSFLWFAGGDWIRSYAMKVQKWWYLFDK